jgi:hypothetical protein
MPLTVQVTFVFDAYNTDAANCTAPREAIRGADGFSVTLVGYTLTVFEFETTPFGFLTTMENDPVEFTEPVAVADQKEARVFSGLPFSIATAPETSPDPPSWMVNGPTPISSGFTDRSIGLAGVMETFAEAVTDGCATLRTCTCTAPEGMAAGAMYLPVVAMYPTLLFPPTTPFTVQTRAVFETFCRVAVNCREVFTMTSAEPGVRLSVAVAFANTELVHTIRLTRIRVFIMPQ